MPVKKRFDKHRAELPAEAVDWLHDGKGGSWVYWQLPEDLAELWREHAEAIVAEYVAEFPGTRPVRWWEYSAPRAKPGEYQCRAGFRPELPSPRRRLGGTGTPKFEVLGVVPCFWCGVPVDWITRREVAFYSGLPRRESPFLGVAIDADDPPMFESAAAYLQRHGLLLAGERRRLKPVDFEPESVRDLIEIDENDLETVR